MSAGLLAVEVTPSWSDQVILLGTIEVLRTDLNTDQNFLLLDFNKAGMDSKNCFRLLVITYFVTRRNSPYFSQSLEHNLRLAFRRNQFLIE
jgi:hypothetical protein